MAGTSNGHVSWADVDSDGDIDALVVGDGTRLYTNNSGSFSASLIAEQLLTGMGAWGDWDNDGDADLYLMGTKSGGQRYSQLWINKSGAFFEASLSITDHDSGWADWGDFDRDGDLDLAIVGKSSLTFADTNVFRNDDGNFAVENIDMVGLSGGCCRFYDYDDDGDLDLVASGKTNSNQDACIIWENDGAGMHEDGDSHFPSETISLTPLSAGFLDVADYSRDGRADLVSSGLQGLTAKTLIYRPGPSSFILANSSLTGVYNGSSIWGDWNNDGLTDLFITGTGQNNTRVSDLYAAAGGDTFNLAVSGITALSESSAAWGDIDGDNDLDLLIAGDSNIGDLTRILTNNEPASNQRPTPPTNGGPVVYGGEADISWNAGSDDHTPSGSRSYNVKIGTTPGGHDMLAPMSLADGTRLVVRPGNAGYNLSMRIKGLKQDTRYYARVQTIDGAFQGSTFTPDISFTTPEWDFNDVSKANMAGVLYGDLAWGDFDSDGDLDLAVTGLIEDTQEPTTRVYINNGSGLNGAFVPLEGLFNSKIAWGDYNGDGRLDLLVCGLPSGAGPPQTILYRNNGGTFSDVTPPDFPDLQLATIAWADVDGDADLDVYLSGRTQFGIVSGGLFRNLGDGSFVQAPGVPAVQRGTATWADYDEDGDQDLLLSGDANGSPETMLLRNDGSGGFSNATEPFVDIYDGTVSWVDYDTDGDLDAFVCGISNLGPVTKLYEHAGGVFSETATDLPAHAGAADWGDHDNDGDPDVFLYGGQTPIAKLYRNQGPGGPEWLFVDISQNLLGEAFNFQPSGSDAVDFGDFDNDGRLDIAYTGGENTVRLYHNTTGAANAAPSVPQNLSALGLGGTDTIPTFQLSWDASSDDNTPSGAITYNIRIGTTPGGSEVYPGLSNSDGYRQVPEMGNLGPQKQYSFQPALPIRYYWSVQAVDSAFRASTWSEEKTLFAASRLYVNGAAAGANNGMRWTDAFNDLQDALAAAAANGGATTEIWVAKGIYKPGSPGASRESTFALVSGVDVIGGFLGNEGTFGPGPNPEAHPTVLDGDLDGNGSGDAARRADNAIHVVTGVGVDDSTELYGFTITGGSADSLTISNFGGGMLLRNGSSPVVRQCTFINNYASSSGGGAACTYGSHATFDLCKFLRNNAPTGAALYVATSDVAVRNTVFSGNTSQNGVLMISNNSDGTTITNSTFSLNQATTSNAAGTQISGSSPTIWNSIYWGNTNSGGSGPTAQIKASSGSPTVSYSDVQGGWSGAGTNNIDITPQFVDANGADNIPGTEDDDVHLRDSSPCIEAGDNSVIVPGDLDIDGNPRIFFASVDMGADEYWRDIVFVDASATGNNNGSSWTHAYTNLQSALVFATSGQEIWVADGSYKPNTGTNRSTSFTLLNGVSLYGGFAGGETHLDARDTAANAAILTGDLRGDDQKGFTNYSDNSFHVVRADNTNSSAVLDGFIITGGNADGSAPDNAGGGLSAVSGDMTVNGCVFLANSAQKGGGVYLQGGAGSFDRCRFLGNSAQNGGGAEIDGCSTSLRNTEFSGNVANFGGAMRVLNSSFLTLTGSTLTQNEAGDGAGIYFSLCSPDITNSIVYGNGGSEMTLFGSSPAITYSNIRGGHAGTGNIGANPLFIDADGADNIPGTLDDNLHIGSISPCIGRGSNASVQQGEQDIDGQERIYASRVDIGSDEYHPEGRIAQGLDAVKQAGDGSWAEIDANIISRTFTDYFYIQKDDRSSGIRVEAPGLPASQNLYARIWGSISTNADGEKFIQAAEMEMPFDGGVSPVWMTNRLLGGTDFLYNALTGAGQQGVVDGFGLNNIGLLVTIWGTVTHVDLVEERFVISDGSSRDDGEGHAGVRVWAPGLALPRVGDAVRATGASSCYKSGGRVYPELLVNSQSDIVPL